MVGYIPKFASDIFIISINKSARNYFLNMKIFNLEIDQKKLHSPHLTYCNYSNGKKTAQATILLSLKFFNSTRIP